MHLCITDTVRILYHTHDDKVMTRITLPYLAYVQYEIRSESKHTLYITTVNDVKLKTNILLRYNMLPDN